MGTRLRSRYYSGLVLRELITRPISMVAALLDLPRTLERSAREANSLMELSREQLEMMRRQADEALAQAERMNDLLARVVKLTEPLERVQGTAEDVTGRLKQILFGEEGDADRLLRQAKRAEDAATMAESAADDAEEAAEDAEVVADEAEAATDEAEVSDGTTIRVIPNRGSAQGDDAGR
jgi:methyl-accepting chemotaxis protein